MDRDEERRKRLASLPFSEKLKILGKLRDRNRVIAASGLRQTPRPEGTSPGTYRQGNAPSKP